MFCNFVPRVFRQFSCLEYLKYSFKFPPFSCFLVIFPRNSNTSSLYPKILALSSETFRSKPVFLKCEFSAVLAKIPTLVVLSPHFRYLFAVKFQVEIPSFFSKFIILAQLTNVIHHTETNFQFSRGNFLVSDRSDRFKRPIETSKISGHIFNFNSTFVHPPI